MSLRTRDLLDAVHWVANDQDGLITAAQLDAIGIPRSTLSRRIRTGGQWRRVLPGTYCVFDGTLTISQRERAAMLFAGVDAVLTGASGLRRWGLEYLPANPNDAPVHSLIPAARHRKSAGFAIVERTQRMPSAQMIQGVPVAPLARCLVDAARRVTDRRSTRAMTLEAIQRELVSIDAVERELRQAQRRGTALIHDTLEEARAGVRSAPEAELRHLALAAGLPLIWWNPTMWTPDDNFLAMPDGVVVESMAVIEVQSRQYHDGDEQFAATLNRVDVLGQHGLLVSHVVPGVLRRDPVGTLRAIRETHLEALARPRPDLRVKDSRGVRPRRLSTP
ncbi:MAG: type IV toxin-antitoxin system AbiEi family antitoxin domain-containing protein [Actinomycetes bacterium]